MNLTTQSKLAKEAGVTRQAVSIGVKNGVIPVVVIEGKKWIDLDDPEIVDYLKGNRQRNAVHGDPAEKSKKSDPPPGRKKAVKSEKTANPAKQRKEPDEQIDDEIFRGLLPDQLQGMSKYDLDRLKTAMAFVKSKTENDIKRGEYIPRETVRKVFHALYRIDSEEFLQMSSHLAPRICQDAFSSGDPQAITKVTELIDTELYKVQNHIRIALNKELKEMGIEGTE